MAAKLVPRGLVYTLSGTPYRTLAALKALKLKAVLKAELVVALLPSAELSSK